MEYRIPRVLANFAYKRVWKRVVLYVFVYKEGGKIKAAEVNTHVSFPDQFPRCATSGIEYRVDKTKSSPQNCRR